MGFKIIKYHWRTVEKINLRSYDTAFLSNNKIVLNTKKLDINQKVYCKNWTYVHIHLFLDMTSAIKAHDVQWQSKTFLDSIINVGVFLFILHIPSLVA